MENPRRFRKDRPVRFLTARLALGSFSFTAPAWPGASFALGTIAANPGFNYAFKLPITAQNDTFVPVIRWNNGATYYRYKLWTTGAEVIPFGTYGGEKIPTAQSPVLEIWTVNGENPVQADTWYLDISPLTDPQSISDTTQAVYTAA